MILSLLWPKESLCFPGRNEITTKGDWQLNLPPGGWLTCQECAKIKSDDHPFLTSFFTAESNFRIYSICKSKTEQRSHERRLKKLFSWISFISLVSSVAVFREVTQRSPFRGSVAWHPVRRLRRRLPGSIRAMSSIGQFEREINRTLRSFDSHSAIL